MKKEVFIVSAHRTAIGSFNGMFSGIPATQLGSSSIRKNLSSIGLSADQIDEVFMGMVLQANAGQAPARQAARNAGIPDNVPCTTVNKVCASGMKSVMFAAQSIQLGENHTVLAGGMENMSMAPYYIEKGRTGYKFGHSTLLDGLVKDGLTDVYHQTAMGVSAELCAKTYNLSREEQDEFAIESYKRSTNSWNSGLFDTEIAEVEIENKKGEKTVINKDEFQP
jgi:acetyl-CoA C-acetyltransferase